MKNLIAILILSGLAYTASAQTKTKQNLHQGIHDDGKSLQITINGMSNNQLVDYNRSFDVTGWNQKEKDALIKRVTDSLGIGNTRPLPPPPPPAAPGGRHDMHSDINDDGKTLRLQFLGTTANQSFNYQRTFNVQGMSKQQKSALIKHITDSLGISQHINITQ